MDKSLSQAGQGTLKERTVGVEVFGRKPDYDNNSDPIVRVTATELRKKLAQYDYEDGHSDEIRIELPPGSYLPRFRRSSKEDAAAADLALVSPPLASVSPLDPPETPAPLLETPGIAVEGTLDPPPAEASPNRRWAALGGAARRAVSLCIVFGGRIGPVTGGARRSGRRAG